MHRPLIFASHLVGVFQNVNIRSRHRAADTAGQGSFRDLGAVRQRFRVGRLFAVPTIETEQVEPFGQQVVFFFWLHASDLFELFPMHDRILRLSIRQQEQNDRSNSHRRPRGYRRRGPAAAIWRIRPLPLRRSTGKQWGI